jgi:Uma2 family endonuclease
MSTAPSRLLTPAEYLARERAAEYKSEYYRGEMFAMSGANSRHVRICVNLVAWLHEKLRNSSCQVFNSDMRVKVTASGLYTYPDASVACGQVQFEDTKQDVLLNPRAIFEVLSKSTERRDRGCKFQNYWNIPSLEEYVLISQNKALVEQFVRKSDGNWSFRHYEGLSDSLQLAAVNCSIPLSELYRDAEFAPEDDEPPTVESTK